MTPLEEFYENQEEPIKSCFIVVRELLLNSEIELKEHWKYKLPFFYLKDKPFCYLWTDKKTNNPYIGFSRGYLSNNKDLIAGDRKKIKIFLFDKNEDIPVDTINAIVRSLMKHY